MPEIVTDIVVNASVDKVWSVLSGFSSYAEWNPYIRRIEGDLQTGASMSVTRVMPQHGESTSNPSITLYRPCREIRLLDRLVLPGLLDAEHGLKLEPLGAEQVRFVHWHSTSGILAPFMSGSTSELRSQLEATNAALKDRVESELHADEEPIDRVAAMSGSEDHRQVAAQPA